MDELEQPDPNQAHRTRMARKKAAVDEKISQAKQARGVIVVATGNGKGKSTSGFGMAARALGHGMQVGIVQFIKGSFSTGEEAFFRRFPEVRYHVMGEGYTWETQDRDRDVARARAAWEEAKRMIADPGYRMVLLDELNIVLRYDYLPLAEVIEVLKARPAEKHVIVTGRNARDALIDIADLVTEMEQVKHPFRSGVKAQAGIEF